MVLPNLPEKILPTKKRSETSKEEAIEWFNRVAEPLRVALFGKEYLVEERLTTADIVIGGVLVWAERLKMLADDDILKSICAKPTEDFYDPL